MFFVYVLVRSALPAHPRGWLRWSNCIASTRVSFYSFQIPRINYSQYKRQTLSLCFYASSQCFARPPAGMTKVARSTSIAFFCLSKFFISYTHTFLISKHTTEAASLILCLFAVLCPAAGGDDQGCALNEHRRDLHHRWWRDCRHRLWKIQGARRARYSCIYIHLYLSICTYIHI